MDTLFGKYFYDIQVTMDRVMEGILRNQRPFMTLGKKGWKPSVDIYETHDDVVIQAELAGVRREDIEIHLEGDILRINGRRVESGPADKIRLHQMEIDYGEFSRVFRINTPIDENDIKAVFKDGFLIVRLPKKTDKVVHNIEIINH